MYQRDLLNHKLVLQARDLATRAHAGQKRKYTGEPYIIHPIAVAHTVSLCHGVTEFEVAAAFLHDVVEDCGVFLGDIEDEFGTVVAHYVDELTKRDFLHPDWNRERRKAFEAGRLLLVTPSAQTIKLADLIDNMYSTIQHDRKFARIYFEEKKVLVDNILTKGDPLLLKLAREQVAFGLQILDKWEELDANKTILVAA